MASKDVAPTKRAATDDGTEPLSLPSKKSRPNDLSQVCALSTDQMSPSVRFYYEVAQGNLLPLSETSRKHIKRTKESKDIETNLSRAQLLVTNAQFMLQHVPYTSNVDQLLFEANSNLININRHLAFVRYETSALNSDYLLEVFCSAILSHPRFLYYNRMRLFFLNYINNIDRYNEYFRIQRQTPMQIAHCYNPLTGVQFVRVCLHVSNGINNVLHTVYFYVIDGIETMATYRRFDNADYIRHAFTSLNLHVVNEHDGMIVLKSNFKVNYDFAEIETGSVVTLNGHEYTLNCFEHC
ncbi:ORF168 [Leucania separata nucleopolyhedrovirus]|uniref:ORF168 n=1 Tax=Leucania separata nucleopolyhedrovirus TaxID=1307956 RepID=Q0IKV1_NPVLS|nr:ORF168 [Leucania separata nucleopolyhedrovirus]AAR28932.1 ORF168 [Leucania separata nucleopolyhedrovirus]